MIDKHESSTYPGWTCDKKRKMMIDSTGRFIIFGYMHNTSLFVLEDRKNNTQLVCGNRDHAIKHAEEIKKYEADSEWRAKRKKKVNAQIEFKRVSASAGFYYWKDAAERRREREARYENFPHAFGRVTDSR